jgi:hypothetical protein
METVMSKKKSGSPTPKKKTKAPRIALHLPGDAPGLFTRGTAIWAAVKADSAHFASPYPPAPEIEADLAALGEALQKAEGGSAADTAAVEVAVAKVRQTFELLGKYVQSIVRAGPIEDAPAIISSVLMYESAVGKRPPKPPLEARQGTTSGAVLLIALAMAGARVYYWESSLDQQSWTAAGQSPGTRFTVAGLAPGKVYFFRFRAFTRDGEMTEYSPVVSLMVA